MYKKELRIRFSSILQRCNNPNSTGYNNYGGRGIKCEWKTFAEFYMDMIDGFNPRLSIDRKDNNGNYCKENCRWADSYTQIHNRRNSKHIPQYIPSTGVRITGVKCIPEDVSYLFL